MQHSIIRAFKTSIITALAAFALTSCGASKNVIYMQNASPESIIEMAEKADIKVEPGDEIMIYVSSSDAEVAAQMSLMAGTRQPQVTNSGVNTVESRMILPYTVNAEGNITMPEIGTIHVAGLTRQQISKEVINKIVSSHLAHPGAVNVTVQFANLIFTTIGEVSHTGNFNITKDRLTILEAIAMSGDLTIHGRRDKVWVIREESDGNRKMYQLDLRGTDFMKSPAYYIQQNDVIYVEPNDVRAGQSTLNENTFKSIGFWTSLASLAMSVATFILTLTR